MKNYAVETVTFVDTLADVMEIEINETGDQRTRGSDGDPYQTLAYVESLYVRASCRSTDLSLNTSSAIQAGATGSLVMVYRKHAQGIGYEAASGNTITATISNAFVTRNEMRAQDVGDSLLSLNWSAVSSDGATSPVAYVVS